MKKIKKLKPCPWCTNTGLILTFNHQFIEICCIPCKLVRQIEYPTTIFDKKIKTERETSEEEKKNYAIDKWNEYEKREKDFFLKGLTSGYSLGVEDSENGTTYDWLRGK